MKAAERGAAFLDETLPGWEQLIDLEELDLSDSCGCVLGQLEQHLHPRARKWSPFYRAINRWLGGDYERADRLGFDVTGNMRYENLTRAWRRLIERRRRASA